MLHAPRAPDRRPLLALACAGLLASQGLAQDCSVTSTGMVPLNDLGPTTYQSFPGGLYAGGANAPPGSLEKDVVNLLRQDLAPLSAAGKRDPDGKIVLASVGMSNTFQEFGPFLTLLAQDPEVSSRVIAVNGAFGGQQVDEWADPDDPLWDRFEQRLQAAGVTGEQLQVVWMKHSAGQSKLQEGFPANALKVTGWMRDTVQNLKAKYPSVKIVYLTSRIYAGYATGVLNPEPYAYENAFSAKWLIEQQQAGDPGLEYKGLNAVAPLLLWGPYLWADGLGPDGVPGGIGGRSDGLEWECSHFESDGTHPSAEGEQRFAELLLDWLKTDVLASPWMKPATVYVDPGPSAPPEKSEANEGARNVPMLQFRLQAPPASEDQELLDVVLRPSGGGREPKAIKEVKLFLDVDQDGTVSGADTLLVSGDFAGDNAQLRLKLDQPFALDPGAEHAFLVVYNLKDPSSGAWLLPLFLLVPWWWRRWTAGRTCAALLLVLAVSGVAITACGGSSGGGLFRGNTFSLELEDVNAQHIRRSEPSDVLGELPQEGTTLTILP